MQFKNTIFPTLLRSAFNTAAPPKELSARIPNYGIAAAAIAAAVTLPMWMPLLLVPMAVVPLSEGLRNDIQIAFNVVAQDIRSVGKLLGMVRDPSEPKPVSTSTKPVDADKFLKAENRAPIQRLKTGVNSL